MRDLAQCQAEVFRRSEKRINARRRRRKRVLMSCIPLVLLVALLATVRLMPERRPEDTAPGMPNGSPVDRNESLTLSVAQIDVSGPGVSLTHTDGARLQRILDGLETSVRPEPSYQLAPEGEQDNSESTRSEEKWDDCNDVMPDGTDSGYTITVTLHDGTATEYRLEGCVLENKATGESKLLTQAQTNELMELLEIPAP